MLFVKKIEVVTVDRDRVENIIFDRQSIRSFDPATRQTEETFQTEIVDGQRFVNARGEELCIGMTTAAREALGLPFGIFEDMSRELQAAKDRYSEDLAFSRSVNARLTARLKCIRGMSFWERLNRVFVGFYTLSIK